MRPSLLLALLCTLSLLSARAGDGKNVVSSSLKSATVYRSGAELVHTATARLQAGANELIVGDLSNAIDIASIRIGCSANVTVISVTFSTDHLQTETSSPFVKKLQDSIEAIHHELGRLDILVKSDNELLDLLASNKSIGSTTAGVNVAELAKMMDYYRQKTLQLRTEISDYTEKSRQLRQVADKLDRQVKEDERKNASTAGSLLLQLMSPAAGPCDLTISYLTTAAHWEPSYDLKVNNSTDPLHIFYKAHVVQTSGIDWKHVKLSLSTSLPSQDNNAPLLKTRFLRFVEAVSSGAAYIVNPGMALANRVSGIQIRGAAAMDKEAEPLFVIDGRIVSKAEKDGLDANMIKKIDVLKGGDAIALYGSRGTNGVVLITTKEELGDYVNVNDRTMDAVFDIDIPYDVPGNGMEQGVTLKEYQLPCIYQYYAAPGVDKDAYLLGQLTGWEKLNLLPGDAGIMVEGTYIGKSRIDPNSIQDTLNLTLGRDKRIVIKKEKITDFSSVKFLGSNKKQVSSWQITVRNNKKEKVRMILKDQYPVSTDKEIEAELLENGGAAVNKDTGILTWNLELAPGESRSYRISYSVKYPKDKVLNIN
ncbi:MAG TPA: DUF4139 domain-containing protein [Puia sp.]